MKRIINSVFLCTALSWSAANAQNAYWSSIQPEAIQYENWKIQPATFKAFDLDVNALKSFMWTLDTDFQKAKILSLPDPNGIMQEFSVWEAPMMEPELAAKYPEIKTFSGVSLSNPFVTAKFDITQFGFHGIVFAEEGTYYIDPINYDGGFQYQIYYKSDFHPESKKKEACLVGNPSMPELFDGELYVPRVSPPPTDLMRTNGNTKKTYRLALACTGEYAQAVTGVSSPTKAAVMAKIVTSINRVNGIYEKELSVHMNLIANNDLVVYTSPSSDPFTANFNGPVLLGQNQSNMQSVIGLSNFDIGHIFSTGGGGIASLGSVCYSSDKARGVTGSSEPYGDPYDVDYVAHEMGHQFGANHTFNNCGGNENDETAYEPGSGSTIMAYAGICGTVNNLQNNSDDYFHPASLNEITAYISGESLGGTGTCATTSAGSSTNISIPSYSASYTIPTSTAFEVEAPTATWSSSTLRYEWEQFNLGQIGRNENIGANATSAPIFRSYKVVANNKKVRSFPKADSVHKNTYSFIGERTPLVARNAKVGLTVRGMSADGYGSFNTSNNLITVNYYHTGSPFTLTAPNTSSVTWTTGTSQSVTWEVNGTNAAPINATNVDIFLSIDGGANYNFTLATNVPNTGSSTITVPSGTVTTKARVKVKGAGNVFYDVSNTNFTIKLGTSTSVDDLDISNLFEVYPNPVADFVFVKFLQAQKTYQIQVSNVLGQQIYTQSFLSDAQINTSTWAAGVFWLEVQDLENGGKAIYKIVKQ